MLAFANIHGLDEARYVGRHHKLGRLNVGIVRRHVAATHQPEPKRSDGDDGSPADHQRAAQQAGVLAHAPDKALHWCERATFASWIARALGVGLNRSHKTILRRVAASGSARPRQSVWI